MCIRDRGYAVNIDTVDGYYKANMDMLEAKNRHELFPEDRPVHTKGCLLYTSRCV